VALDIRVLGETVERDWNPNKKQAEFIRCPYECFEALYGGAAGGGKSELLLMLPLIYGFVKRAGFKGIILRRTFPELESEIILRSKEIYKYAGGVYNESKRRWVWSWPDGDAYIQFGHAENEADIRKYDTAQYNYIAFDELTSFTEFQYLYLSFERGRSGVAGLPSIIRSATNPGNTGHTWVKKRFVLPYRQAGKLDGDGGCLLREYAGISPLDNKPAFSYRFFLQALATDNPVLMKNDPGYITRMQLLPEAEKRAKLYGDWDTFEGQVFEEWRTEAFPKEPENAIHLIEKFEIPEWWPRIVSIDWGWTAPTWIGWGAISPDSRVYGYREYHKKKKYIQDYAADFIRMSEAEHIKGVILCHSAFAHRGEPQTIAEQFETASGFAPINGGRDRIAGKLLAHEYLRWKQKSKTKIPQSSFDLEAASRVLRTSGLKAYHDYLDLFVEQPEEKNLPKWQQFKSEMPELERCIPVCVYDKDDKEDVAEFDGDDPYDGWRGLLKYADNYVHGLIDIQVEKKKQEEAYERLLRSGNQTAFYREMEKMEASSGGAFGVRSHRRVRRLR
jgi:hypothetical protein